MTNKLFTWMLLGAITLGAITGCEEKPDDEPTIMVTEIVLNDTTLSLQPGSSAMLEVTSVEPANAADTTITWSSNPTGWVDATGKVTVPTAATAGQTGIITATANDGGRAKTECTITVLAGSDTDPDPEEMTSQMILTTTARVGEKTFNMVGSGTASIDWGDGLITPPFPVAPYVLSHTYLNNYGNLNGDDYSIIISCQNVTHLNCHKLSDINGNGFTSIDVSKNTALTYLNCYHNQLTSLDVSKNTALTYLNCGGNPLESLDVSKNTVLTDLNCGGNLLESLDVSKNTALTYLNCGGNQLTSLDVSKNTVLTDLDCGGNQLTSLDVSKNTALTNLNCSYNNQLTSLNVSGATALTDLNCSYNNQLTSLNVSGATALTNLNCSYNNQLTSLNVSGATALTYLNCYSNQLTSLDVSGATALTYLDCYSNQLTSLDVSSATKLNRLHIRYNQFTGAELNALFTTLHSNTVEGGKTIYIYGNPGAGECDRSIAEAKGWMIDM